MPSWLLVLFQRLLELSGKATIAEVWPTLEVVVHGGVKFDPYREAFADDPRQPAIRLQETYPCSEGFIAFGDPATGLLRLVFDHGIFYEFVPVDELDSHRPTRHWLGNVQAGVNYAIVVSTCAGMWAHVIGDTVRFESLVAAAADVHRADQVHALGLRRAPDQRGGRGGDRRAPSATRARRCATGTSGPVFRGPLGHHHYVVEFLKPPDDLAAFRRPLDADLCRRNADYQAHRAEGVGLPLPALVVARPGGFDDWMRSRGKLGGQHKVPRMDNTGALTRSSSIFSANRSRSSREIAPVCCVTASLALLLSILSWLKMDCRVVRASGRSGTQQPLARARTL